MRMQDKSRFEHTSFDLLALLFKLFHSLLKAREHMEKMGLSESGMLHWQSKFLIYPSLKLHQQSLPEIAPVLRAWTPPHWAHCSIKHQVVIWPLLASLLCSLGQKAVLCWQTWSPLAMATVHLRWYLIQQPILQPLHNLVIHLYPLLNQVQMALLQVPSWPQLQKENQKLGLY